MGSFAKIDDVNIVQFVRLVLKYHKMLWWWFQPACR